MSWHTYLATIEARKALVTFDDQFRTQLPIANVPHLFWVGIWCRLPPGAAFWDPAEGDALDRIEKDLLTLCEHHGHGWAIYIRCVHTPGIREYYFYASEQAELEKAARLLMPMHLNYRIESDRIADPEWRHYRKWLAEPREPLPKR